MTRERRYRGAGSLFRRGPYWYAQINVPATLTADGKRKRHTFTGKTFCGVLKRLSEAQPPIPVPPVSRKRIGQMAAARALGNHTKAEWYALVRATKRTCHYCKQPGRMTKDHIIPVSRGGSDAIDNIVPACMSCNYDKHQLTAEEYLCYRTLLGQPYGAPVEEAKAWAERHTVVGRG